MSKLSQKPTDQEIVAEIAPNAHVARQYEQWVYPAPIMDLKAPEHSGRDGGDYELNWYTFWPNQEKREKLNVLIAGCGSNAAARYAFNHPQAQVTGIDLSSSSLAHEEYLKNKHSLGNLALHQGRIEDAVTLGKRFDFVDCSGVLHHLPDPVSGLNALGNVLEETGTIAIMVYGQYGRTGVYMLQEMFRLMGLGQTPEDVITVKQTLAALPPNHVIQDYARRTRDTKYDAGLVDNFLHRQDRAYTVKQCLEFVSEAGLSFVNWLDNIFYYPDGQLNPAHDFYRKVNSLSELSIWEFMELYNGTLGQHAFAVAHPSRDPKTYRVDFTGSAFMDYIPVLRSSQVKHKSSTPEAQVKAGSIAVQRPPFPVFTLSPSVSSLYQQIDGKKTVRACFDAAGFGNKGEEALVCRSAFRYLWRLGYVFLRLPA